MTVNVPLGLEATIGGTAAPERWNLNIDSQGRLTFNANSLSGGNTRMVIDDDSGNVGLGTTTPQAALHLYSPSNPTTLRIQSSAGFGAGRLEFWSDPQGSSPEWRPGFIQSTDQAGGTWTGGLAFFVNGTGLANRVAEIEVMRITNGRVGIGTTNPQATLDVNGDIKVKDWTLSVPDYVFTADYELRNLNELRSYIDRYQHLPEVPSAQTISEEGVNLGEFCMALLKKIEELSLYILQQHEAIQVQNDRLVKLENSARS